MIGKPSRNAEGSSKLICSTDKSAAASTESREVCDAIDSQPKSVPGAGVAESRPSRVPDRPDRDTARVGP